MKIKNTIFKTLSLFCFFLLVTGCGSQVVDKSLKIESYAVSESKVLKKQETPGSTLTSVYKGIDDMYKDCDYVISGVVKDIQYFQYKDVLLRKINVLVNKNYKGSIKKNTMVSVIENDGYMRLKSLYESTKKAYEEKYGDKDKEKEDTFLYYATLESDKKDIDNDMLIKYYYINKKDSKVGDELLLFMTDSSDDTYKDKNVRFVDGKLSYPKGAYVTLGNGMGKFTRSGSNYQRYNLYSIPGGTINGLQKIKESYTVTEMKNELKKLK